MEGFDVNLGDTDFALKAFLFEALKEDWGRGDLFSLVAEDKRVQAQILAKSDGIFSGEKYLRALMQMSSLKLLECFKDSQEFSRGDVLVRIEGGYLDMLKIERVALNLLQHSSGIATNTHRFVQELKGLEVRLLDTRKTRPLLREFEKYSVCNGGGSNHRFGLDSALMLKDTHLSQIVDLKAFIAKAKKRLPFTTQIEVECESLKDCKRAFEAGADIVMCDNMAIDEIIQAVQIRNQNYPHILLEASGNLSLGNLKLYAQSGVDALSCGSLIHQATWLDMSMKIREGF